MALVLAVCATFLLSYDALALQKDTWKRLSMPGRKPIGCGFFWDKDHGVVGSGIRPGTHLDLTLGYYVVDPGLPVSIYKTTDGGATWKESVRPYDVSGAVTQICMTDSLNGYASIFSDVDWSTYHTFGKCALWRTSDGGDTWIDDLNLDHVATSVYAQKDLLLYTSWDLSYTNLRLRDLPLFPQIDTFGAGISYDGGKTWHRQFRRCNGIAFSDSLNGVITEMNPQWGLNFWYTFDAGRTWFPTNAQVESWSIYAVKGQRIYFTANESQLNLPHSTINWSTDGGVTWSPRATLPNMHFTGTIQGAGSTLYIQTDSTLYDSVLLHGLYRSDDLGATWHWIAGPDNSRDTRFVVAGCSGEVVYAFDGEGGVWKTIDGGDGTLADGNPNDADFATSTLTLSLHPNPCSDTISFGVFSTSCPIVTIDSVVQIGAGDLSFIGSGTTTPLPARLAHQDSLRISFLYHPKDSASSVSTLRVYGHSGSRRLTRDVHVSITNGATAGIILMKPALTLMTVGCDTARDTLSLAGLGCAAIILDSLNGPQGEIHLRASLPDTLADGHVRFLPIEYAPDSAGVHDLTIHLFAHYAERRFDTIVTVHAESKPSPFYFYLDTTTIDFHTAYCNSDTASLTLATSSCDSITVDSVITSSARFTPLETVTGIPAHGAASLPIGFAPDSIGVATGSVRVYAHDRDRAIDTVVTLRGVNRGLSNAIWLARADTSITTTGCQIQSITLPISNQGCDDLVIDTLSSGSNELDVSYDVIRTPLESNDTLKLSLSFSPDSGGTRSIPVHLVMHSATRRIDTTIIVQATNNIPSTPLVFSDDTLRFLTKYCQPQSMSVNVVNFGCSTMTIDTCMVLSDSRNEFSLDHWSRSVWALQAGSAVVIFHPDTSGRSTARLRVVGTTYRGPFDTVLTLIGTNVTAPEPYLPLTDSMLPGGRIEIPIMLRPTFDSFTIASYTAHLRFNTDLIEPDVAVMEGTLSANYSDCSLEKRSDGATIRVSLRQPITDTSQFRLPLVKLRAKVYLTTGVFTSVLLDTFATDREPSLELCSMPTEAVHAILSCGNDWLIELMKTGSVSLTSITVLPNPVAEQREWQLRFRAEKPAEVAVSLYDTGGNEIAHYAAVSATAGEHALSFPSPEESGDYFIVVRSGSGATVRKLSVTK